MKKLTLLFILVLFSVSSFAKIIEAKYDVTYGSLLDLGVATTTLEINKNTYTIKIVAKTTGMARHLSKNRVEIYESYGIIKDNEFIPNKHIKTKKDDDKQRTKTYTFDHKNKKIFVENVKSGIKINYNAQLEKVEVPFSSKSISTLDYYAKDDLLSLFFNIKDVVKDFEKGKEYSLKAVGANKTKGVINIAMPDEKRLKMMNEVLKTDDKIKFTAYINQKIFQSKRGELLISLNKHGFCTFTVLKDVLLFGDIVGKMKEFSIKEN